MPALPPATPPVRSAPVACLVLILPGLAGGLLVRWMMTSGEASASQPAGAPSPPVHSVDPDQFCIAFVQAGMGGPAATWARDPIRRDWACFGDQRVTSAEPSLMPGLGASVGFMITSPVESTVQMVEVNAGAYVPSQHLRAQQLFAAAVEVLFTESGREQPQGLQEALQAGGTQEFTSPWVTAQLRHNPRTEEGMETFKLRVEFK